MAKYADIFTEEFRKKTIHDACLDQARKLSVILTAGELEEQCAHALQIVNDLGRSWISLANNEKMVGETSECPNGVPTYALLALERCLFIRVRDSRVLWGIDGCDHDTGGATVEFRDWWDMGARDAVMAVAHLNDLDAEISATREKLLELQGKRPAYVQREAEALAASRTSVPPH
jgi:hypothetical protein